MGVNFKITYPFKLTVYELYSLTMTLFMCLNIHALT